MNRLQYILSFCTGLGLAIIHGIIVKKHQGKINFYSNSNQSTDFIISIPLLFFWLLGFPLLNPTYESQTRTIFEFIFYRKCSKLVQINAIKDDITVWHSGII
jgi:hypothetical protein